MRRGAKLAAPLGPRRGVTALRTSERVSYRTAQFSRCMRDFEMTTQMLSRSQSHIGHGGGRDPFYQLLLRDCDGPTPGTTLQCATLSVHTQTRSPRAAWVLAACAHSQIIRLEIGCGINAISWLPNGQNLSKFEEQGLSRSMNRREAPLREDQAGVQHSSPILKY